MDQPLELEQSIQLQLKRAVTITIATPGGEQIIQTSASTVADALHEAGYKIGLNDNVSPSLDTIIVDLMRVNYTPAQNLTISIGPIAGDFCLFANRLWYPGVP